MAPTSNPTFFETRDLVFLSVTILLSCSTFCKGIYQYGGDAIVLFLSVFSFLNPFSAVAYLGASQVMPYPPMIYERYAITTAQLSVVGFTAYIFGTGSFRAATHGVLVVLAWIWPYLLWAHLFKDLVVFQNYDNVKISFIAYSSAMIAACYAPRVQGRFQLWIFSLCLGSLVGVAAYIFSKLGIAANVEMIYAPERGADRLWVAGRQNEVSICIAGGVGGLLGTFTYAYMFLGKSRASTRILYWLGGCAAVFLALGTLTVLATLSRGGLAGLAATVVAWVAWVAFLQRRVAGKRGAGNLLQPLLALGGVLVFIALIPGLGVAEHLQAMRRANKVQSGSGKRAELIAGRATEWTDSVNFILHHPLVGMMPGDKYERHSYFEEKGIPLSHNVFLDAARAYGVLGFLLYVLYFCGPTYMLVKRKGLVFSGPALLTFIPIFVLLNTLSHSNHKMMHTYNGMVIGYLAVSMAAEISERRRIRKSQRQLLQAAPPVPLPAGS